LFDSSTLDELCITGSLFFRFQGLAEEDGYTCQYDDNRLYPPGWCEMTGHTLEAPGHDGIEIFPEFRQTL